MDASSTGFHTVLDLPQLYTRPTADELISTLEMLTREPTSWDIDSKEPKVETYQAISEAGIPKYLTSIVASALGWIEEERREEIWETASKRLSERSGRAAIPSMSRAFLVSNPFTKNLISITLHEPSLTSDNLGHKTWLASYLLAKRLPCLLPFLPSLHDSLRRESSKTSGVTPEDLPRILELGAGTGLVGIATAAIFPFTHVHLSDLPAITPNLQDNVIRNWHHISGQASERKISVGVLDWSFLLPDPENRLKYDIILAADPLYTPLHPTWLVNTVTNFLETGANARFVVELPLRDVYLAVVNEFRAKTEAAGLKLVNEGEEVGVEDWECNVEEGEKPEVKCWWGVWMWGS